MHSSSFVVGYEKTRLLVCVCLQCSDQLVYGLTAFADLRSVDAKSTVTCS